MKSNKLFYFLITVTSILIFVVLIEFFSKDDKSTQANEAVTENIVKENLNQFGFNDDSLNINKATIKRNETLSSILNKFHISSKKIAEIAQTAKPVFDVREINYGKKYLTFSPKDKQDSLLYFVYQDDPVNFVVISFEDSLNIYAGKKEVTSERKTAADEITQSLYQSLEKNEADPELAVKLSDIYAWQIDFFRIQKGDSYKVIYEEEYVDGKPIGIGKILGAYFKHKDEEFYAINFREADKTGFYDENGNSLRKAFLKAPLKFSRISSHYTKRRFHPILKRFKAHLGTDYAAAPGTPIHTVGDGVVTEARHSKYNGNFVKIRHNSIYSTQYLHMSHIAKGIKPGVRVRQGQVIGFVGSTGLATGPHLCYRFWKNGVQVDPFKQKIPPSHPVDKKYLDAFNAKKKVILQELDSIKIGNENEHNIEPAA